MTNLQLWLSIGIPSLLIVLNWMQTNQRFSDFKENMDQRFDQIDRRFDLVDQRFSRIDHRLDQLDTRLTNLEADYREFYGMEKKLEGRVDELSRR